jgi:hypothetical protein
MELVPHSEFSKLHIGQFLPPDAFTEDDSGLEQSILGFFRCRHYFMARHGWLLFHYPDSPPSVLAGIDVSLTDAELAAGVSDRILAACAPVLRAKMHVCEIIAVLGSPELDTCDGGETGFCRFRVGDRSPYRVGCSFRAAAGLDSFWIVREDYFTEDDA